MLFSFAVTGIIYTALTAIRQLDIKRIIAYSSISHMNLVVIGIFSGNIESLQGSMFLMLSHGLVSTGLFILAGSIYDRFHSRLISYYSGLAQTMPIFSTFFFLFIISNFALPGTSNFVGEILIKYIINLIKY